MFEWKWLLIGLREFIDRFWQNKFPPKSRYGVQTRLPALLEPAINWQVYTNSCNLQTTIIQSTSSFDNSLIGSLIKNTTQQQHQQLNWPLYLTKFKLAWNIQTLNQAKLITSTFREGTPWNQICRDLKKNLLNFKKSQMYDPK